MAGVTIRRLVNAQGTGSNTSTGRQILNAQRRRHEGSRPIEWHTRSRRSRDARKAVPALPRDASCGRGGTPTASLQSKHGSDVGGRRRRDSRGCTCGRIGVAPAAAAGAEQSGEVRRKLPKGGCVAAAHATRHRVNFEAEGRVADGALDAHRAERRRRIHDAVHLGAPPGKAQLREQALDLVGLRGRDVHLCAATPVRQSRPDASVAAIARDTQVVRKYRDDTRKGQGLGARSDELRKREIEGLAGGVGGRGGGLDERASTPRRFVTAEHLCN